MTLDVLPDALLGLLNICLGFKIKGLQETIDMRRYLSTELSAFG